MSQRVTHFALTTNISGAAAQAFAIYVLCMHLDWGLTGIAWATAINFYTRFAITILLVRFGPGFERFDDVSFFSHETIEELGP